MHPSPLLVCPLLSSCLLAVSFTAGAQRWVPVGPPGGDVRALAVDHLDPSRVYLGTAEGVLYRSDAGGATWTRPEPGFSRRGQSLDALVVNTNGTLLVGFWDLRGQGGGVALSDDGGRTFTFAAGLDGQSVRALALAPSDARQAVAGTLDGVFASRDGGRSWRRISPEGHAALRNVGSLAIDPRDPRVIYAGTRHLPWKTTDGGLTWAPRHDGLVDDSDIFALTLDRRDPQRVFAAACSGVHQSRDGGARWTRVRGIPHGSRRTRAFAQDATRPDAFYAGTTDGLWTSDDDGRSWRLVTPPKLVVNALATLPDGVLLLGSDGAGVLRSADRGRTWTPSNSGFSERFVTRLVFDPLGPRVLAGVWGDRQHGGVWAARTPRAAWVRLGVGLEGREVLALAGGGGLVLAGTDAGLFALRAPDTRWRLLPLAPTGQETPPRVADVAVLEAGVLLAATPLGLQRSADAGLSWRPVSARLDGPVTALAMASDDPRLIVVASALGFWTSADAGVTWLTRAAPSAARVNAVALLPGSPRLVLLAAHDGFYRSDDLGCTWTRVGWGLPHSDITGLATHPDGRRVYVSDFAWGGVYRSRDRGQTWSQLGEDGLASDRVWTLAVDPAAPDELLAASRAGGLHLFTTGGLPSRSRQ